MAWKQFKQSLVTQNDEMTGKLAMSTCNTVRDIVNILYLFNCLYSLWNNQRIYYLVPLIDSRTCYKFTWNLSKHTRFLQQQQQQQKWDILLYNTHWSNHEQKCFTNQLQKLNKYKYKFHFYFSLCLCEYKLQRNSTIEDCHSCFLGWCWVYAFCHSVPSRKSI